MNIKQSNKTDDDLTESRNPMRIRILSILVVAAVLSAGMAVVTTQASADHIESFDQGDIEKDADDLKRYGGPWYRGNGGGTGLSGFYYTYKKTSRAYWYFGNLRGVYRAETFYPGRGAYKGTCHWWDNSRGKCRYRPPTASPRFEIQRKNDNGLWQTVRTLDDSILDSEGNYKEGWWGWNGIQLEGNIRVKITKKSGDRLAAARFRFEWQADRTLSISETPKPDVVWNKWTIPFDDDDVTISWERVSNAIKYEIEWRYLGFNTQELRKTYDQLFRDDIPDDERRRLQDRLQNLEVGYEVRKVSGNSRANPGSGPESICYVSSRICKQWHGKKDEFDPNQPRNTVHSLQTHILFQTRVRALASETSGPWSTWTSYPGQKESITCIAFDIYKIIKDVTFALKAADFVLAVGAIMSGGATAAVGVALKKVLKEIAKEILKKSVIKKVVKEILKRLLTLYVKETGKAFALRAFKVLSGCVTAGLELDSSHSRTLWKDILLDPALELPRSTTEKFLDAVW